MTHGSTLKHHQSHLHYADISINKDIKDFVEGHKHESAANIWMHVLAQNPTTEMILKKMEGMEVKIIPIHSEAGIHAIAFTFKEILNDWAEKTEELVMDSTWRMNTAQYELYGFVAKAKSQAMPFAFLFTISSRDSAEGAKTRMLCEILKFMNKCCPNIIFTLSNKEPAEINTCRTEITKAKHQLCYWHAITYIEKCLAENNPPTAYDPRKAHKIFDFINPTWALGFTAVYADEDKEGHSIQEDGDEEAGMQMLKPSQTCMVADRTS
ncbi:hypothetical protein C8R44DRAFT_738117 [Mycena epipterygia]|nr:hypothetical protein C8R44DRAFT_738117 [Mycena epipterygia]